MAFSRLMNRSDVVKDRADVTSTSLPRSHIPTPSFRGAPLSWREPGIHTPDGGYGFRACAKRRIPK
jgi:hypothetical protein